MSLGSFVLVSWSFLATASLKPLCCRGSCSSTSRQPRARRVCTLFIRPVFFCLFCAWCSCCCSEKLACELLLIEQNTEVLLRVEDYLGDLRLPFAVAAHLSPGGCRFMALSPDENERGLRPCICLARIPWTDSDRIVTGFAHIVVPFPAACQDVARTHLAMTGVRQALLGNRRESCRP